MCDKEERDKERKGKRNEEEGIFLFFCQGFFFVSKLVTHSVMQLSAV